MRLTREYIGPKFLPAIPGWSWYDADQKATEALARYDAREGAEAREERRTPESVEREPDGVSLITAERKRQVESEGWTAEHDDEHADESLARVAAIYALPPTRRLVLSSFPDGRVEVNLASALWPQSWSQRWYKPTPDNRVRELVKAGALIAAEIDRLRRAAPEPQEGS